MLVKTQTNINQLPVIDIESKNYILGCGIAGLIFNYYNPGFTIISPDIGGQIKDFNTVLIHDQPETRNLFEEVNLQYKPYVGKIGYYYNRKINENVNRESSAKIILKKMSPWNSIIDTTFKIPSTVLSVPENYIKCLEADFELLITKLQQRIKNFYLDKVVQLNVFNKNIVTENRFLVYNKLISTLPAPLFWKLSNVKIDELKYLPVTIAMTKRKPILYDDNYIMIYYQDSDIPFVRIFKKDDHYVLEFTGSIPLEKIKEIDNTIEQKIEIPVGRIFPNMNINRPPASIVFLGRNAEWNYDIKMQQVIKKSIEYKYNE